MKKKLKKIICLIIIVLIIIIKIFQINFIEKVRIKIENFEKLENSYCNEDLTIKNKNIETSRFSKDKKIKEVIYYTKDGNSVIRLIDINKNKKIIVKESSNLWTIEENKKNIDIKIKNIPWVIKIANEIKKETKEGNIFSIFYCFKILYIIPSQYNGIECYKIRTTREILYVNKDTLYPVYLEYNQNNSNENEDKTKIEYIFEENTVTDDDMKLPNLDNYILSENLEN